MYDFFFDVYTALLDVLTGVAMNSAILVVLSIKMGNRPANAPFGTKTILRTWSPTLSKNLSSGHGRLLIPSP